jgi:HD domain
MLQSNSQLQFWGKTRAVASANGAPLSHRLVHHSLDVAAVAERLLTAFPRRLACIAGLCRSEPEAAKAFLIRLIALHDLGKFHPSFQMKVPDICLPELVREGASGGGRHDATGYEMLESEEFDILGDFRPCLKDWDCPLASPELLIVSPDPDEPSIDKDWYAALSRRARG